MHKTLKKNVSLVELLCTIGIIMILSALLLTTVVKVRERARRTSNISNLKQLSLATQMYMTDNNGFLPYLSEDVDDSRCLFLLLPYTSYSLEVFFPPQLFEDMKNDPESKIYLNNPKLILKHMKDNIGLGYYPGYAYSPTDTNKKPYFDSKMESVMPIVTNINGTYPNTVYILNFDGSVIRVSGTIANDSVIGEE